MSLNPYVGPWTKKEAGHLLRRTMFGATNQQILDAVNNGLPATVASLLQVVSIPPPVAFDPGETIVAQGTTWVNAVYPATQPASIDAESARYKSLIAWTMQNINQESSSITEKMLLFWQNHFGLSPSNSDARAMYQFINLLRQNALGNFKQLVKDVTIDPAMLRFLNGSSNTVSSPNENYARELLELFTIGKGAQIDAGDYSYYTEMDVASGSKILTGFKVTGIKSATLPSAVATYTPGLHNTNSKQLSYHFNDLVVANNGANEYSDYIDIIFQQPQVAVFICTKLYRYFVNYDLTQDVINTVIPSLAQTLIANNYNILSVLQELFLSEHFFYGTLRGTIIRNPLDMLFSVLNATETLPTFDLVGNSNVYLTMYYSAENMGLSYAEPPTVSGWPAYYQVPAYSKLWINSTTIKYRFDLVSGLLFSGLTIAGNNFKLNTMGFLNALSIPSSAPDVINDICDVFFPETVSLIDKDILKNILTNNLPDFEWTLQYNDYLLDPTNPVVLDPVRQRLELVLSRVFKMPQFQMI
jgi:uncharacterized protein (DUF1800 family)